MASFILNTNDEELRQCAADSEENIKEIKNITKEFGSKGLLVQYQLDSAPSIGMKNSLKSLIN